MTYNWGGGDAFVAKVNSSGDGLVYCGYIGGSSSDWGLGIAVDGSGNAYVTGETGSTESLNFPVKTGPDLTHNGGDDAFVAKVSASGIGLVYCGYIGGSNRDWGYGIAVDDSGSVYVTGETRSNEATFPVKFGPDLTHNGGTYGDAFVAKVSASGDSLVYCGYIGGSDNDYGYGIAVDSPGSAYVTGRTSSVEASFPVKVGPGLTSIGGDDAFVAKVSPSGDSLVYCGYIGPGYSSGYGIAVDGSGNAYIAGMTNCSEATFPVKAGPDLTYNGGNYDAFVAKVTPSGNNLVYLGYIGGSSTDSGYGVAVDSSGNAYVTGSTSSSEASFPVLGGPYLTGGNDAFVAKVSYSEPLATLAVTSPNGGESWAGGAIHNITGRRRGRWPT